MLQKYNLKTIEKLKFSFKKPMLIYLKGDLWSWKTTLTKYILNDLLKVEEDITSPTYTYYNKFEWILNGEKIDIYHFDLYRLKDYDEFFAIAWEDVLDNNNWIIIVEWPELIEKYYKCDLKIKFNKTKNEDEREIEVN